MKTKIIFTLLVALLLVAFNQKPYPEKDAKLLIQNRVKKCIKVDKVDADNFNNGLVTYAAIDSAYNTFSFLVTPKGEIIPWYKNGRWIKKGILYLESAVYMPADFSYDLKIPIL